MIELSLSLPMYKAKHIGWLPLEGLIRQKDVSFEWELVIAEEQEPNYMGYDKISGYSKRLEDVGCVNIIYIPCSEWIPLCRKMGNIIDMMDKESKIYTGLSADSYPPTYKLHNTYHALNDTDMNWYISKYDTFYDIKTECVAMYDVVIKGFGKSGLMKYMKFMPKSNRERMMDTWFLNEYKKIVKDFKPHIDETDNWKTGFNTNGLNNLSDIPNRRSNISNLTGKFHKYPFEFTDNVPDDIIQRLKECKQYVGN